MGDSVSRNSEIFASWLQENLPRETSQRTICQPGTRRALHRQREGRTTEPKSHFVTQGTIKPPAGCSISPETTPESMPHASRLTHALITRQVFYLHRDTGIDHAGLRAEKCPFHNLPLLAEFLATEMRSRLAGGLIRPNLV
jgi:hypothetical protein